MYAPNDRVAQAAAHNPDCLGCGADNPASAGLRVVSYVSGALRATGRLGSMHAGGVDRAHGGAVATLLDELVGRLAHLDLATDCLTAYLNCTYLLPTPLHTDLDLRAEVTSRDGRKLFLVGELHADGLLLARAEALMLQTREAAQAATAGGASNA